MWSPAVAQMWCLHRSVSRKHRWMSDLCQTNCITFVQEHVVSTPTLTVLHHKVCFHSRLHKLKETQPRAMIDTSAARGYTARNKEEAVLRESCSTKVFRRLPGLRESAEILSGRDDKGANVEKSVWRTSFSCVQGWLEAAGVFQGGC